MCHSARPLRCFGQRGDAPEGERKAFFLVSTSHFIISLGA